MTFIVFLLFFLLQDWLNCYNKEEALNIYTWLARNSQPENTGDSCLHFANVEEEHFDNRVR